MAASNTPIRIAIKTTVRAGGYGEWVGNQHSRL